MTTRVEIPSQWRLQLSHGLAAMSLPLGTHQCEALLGYLGLLRRWNRAFNLTAVRDPGSMVRRQLLDSLSLVPWLDRGPVLDVGTGAGLPGIPLAIACPGVKFTLIDSNGKKTRFVQQVVGEYGIANVEVIRQRVEQLERPGHYRTIVSRALGSLVDTISATESLLAPAGCWLAMKGAEPAEEMAALHAGLSGEVVPLQVPGETGERHLVVIRRLDPV
jgi:16S rRNA (guanine527-N7)-methyltransferase